MSNVQRQLPNFTQLASSEYGRVARDEGALRRVERAPAAAERAAAGAGRATEPVPYEARQRARVPARDTPAPLAMAGCGAPGGLCTAEKIFLFINVAFAVSTTYEALSSSTTPLIYLLTADSTLRFGNVSVMYRDVIKLNHLRFMDHTVR